MNGPINTEFVTDLYPSVQASTADQKMMALLASGINAQVISLCGMGVPPLRVVDMLLEFCGMILARIDPKEARDEILQNIRKNLPQVVERYHVHSHKSSGGVILP
jgi:hypothetical protein